MWSVDRLAGVYAYLAVVLRAAILIFQSLILGGVTFIWWALRRPAECSSSQGIDIATAKCLRLLRMSGLLLSVAHALCLLVNCRVLIGSTGLSIPDIIGANFVLAAFIAICSGLLIAQLPIISSRRMWPALVLALLILASSVMTNHAAARMNDRFSLILMTTLHLAAAGAWIGGLPYLRIAVSAAPDEIARSFAKRFSYIATLSVSVLAVSGVAASLKYVDSAAALYGTSYGVMLGAKACLFAALLLLGAVNNMGIRKLASVKLAPRLKRCVEAEIVIGITVFLAAASLTSQPPAIDLKTDRVSLSAIYQRARPTWPRLKTPDLKDISPATRHAFEKTAIADATLLQSDIAHPNTDSDIAWSEYNHNWVGLMLLVMGMFAFLSRTGKVPIARHWPLIFLALAIFIFIRADPENWPLGPNGFWESFDQIEVVQHRAAALMVVAFAVFEWRVQGNKTRSAVVPLVFPAVCVVGGALLLTHTHALANSKDQVLAELSHTPLALLAVFAGSMRWLELRLPRPDTKIPGRIWPVCFMLIGVLLLTYKER
jgi:putative copper resistance protein D